MLVMLIVGRFVFFVGLVGCVGVVLLVVWVSGESSVVVVDVVSR